MSRNEAQKITLFLWFDGNAEATKFSGMTGPNGKPLTVAFELEGLSFTALNGGPQFKFNESVSFVVRCKDQAKIDHYWRGLIADGGGDPNAAG